MSDYPECDKITEVKDKSQLIGDFLEWLQCDKGFSLAKYVNDDEYDELVLVAYNSNIENLLAEYFGIDLNEVEKEKRLMLQKLRELNQ